MDRMITSTSFSSSTTCGDFGQLSDEVILMILNYLPSKDLYSLIKTCRRLHSLCQEEKLWGTIDDPPDTRESLSFALGRLINPRTRRVRLSVGFSPLNRGYRTSLTPSGMQLLLQNQQLDEIHLINQQLDATYFRLHDLPQNIRVLDMSGCVLFNLNKHKQYLKELSNKLQQLEDLNLSHCSFVTADSLMSISKLPKLVKLSLRGCRKIGECLAYVALSSRYGFSNLKVLDVTDTRVGSVEFSSFAGIPTLEEFYFGQYDPFVDHPINYITDLCLTRIRSSPTLKALDISGTRVTDRSIEILESIPNLERVVAHFTSFSKDAIDVFHVNRPQCTIYMEQYPVEVPLPNSPPPPQNYGNIHQDELSEDGNGEVIVIDINRNAHNHFPNI